MCFLGVLCVGEGVWDEGQNSVNIFVKKNSICIAPYLYTGCGKNKYSHPDCFVRRFRFNCRSIVFKLKMIIFLSASKVGGDTYSSDDEYFSNINLALLEFGLLFSVFGFGR